MISTVTGKSNITQSSDTESAEPTNHTFNIFSIPNKYSDICYEVGKCGSPSMSCAFTPEQLIVSFSIKSAAACKMYCWFHKSCFSFAFHPQALNCSLYSGFPTMLSPSDEFKSPPYVIGDTICLKNYEKSPSVPCRTVENVIKTSQNSEGVLIKDVNSGLCLGFGTLMDLKWKDCTLSILWQFETNSHEIGRLTPVKVLQADSLNHCIETTSKVANSSQRFMSVVPCEDGNEDQLFQITSGTLHDLSYMKDHERNDNTCFFSITRARMSIYPESSPQVNLAVLRVLKPEEHLALCKRNMFKAAHGEVLGDIPFYLPGEKVPITCMPGYGFKRSKNQSTVNVTCRNEKSRAEKCVKLEVKRTVVLSEGESRVFDMSVCANIGQVILIIFLIACVLVLKSKLRALKAGHEGFVKKDKTVPKMTPEL